MNNLKLFSNFRINHNHPNVRYVLKCKEHSRFEVDYFVCVDDKLYMLRDKKFTLLWNIGLHVESPEVVGMQYDQTYDSLVIAFQTGEIYEIANFSDSKPEVAEIIKFDCIRAIQWSPRADYIVVISEKVIHVLTTTFNIVSEHELMSEEPGESSLMNIGWGSSDSQFQGTRKKLVPQEIVTSNSLPLEDRDCRISWRHGANHFAVSFYNSISKKRQIKIFKSKGALQCRGEDLQGLEGPITWIPFRSTLMVCQRMNDRNFICVMEKNGMIKQETFEIRSDVKINNMSWNIDGTIFAIHVCNRETQKECIQLWTRANYVWQLKQEIPCDFPVGHFEWDDQNPHKYVLALSNGEFTVSQWITTVDCERSFHHTSSTAVVALIDGDKVRLTDFKQAIIPPPEYQWTVRCHDIVSSVMFPSWDDNPEQDRKSVFSVLTNDNKISVYTINEAPELTHTLTLRTLLVIDKILWIAPHEFIVLSTPCISKSILYHLTMSQENMLTVKTFHTLAPDSHVTSISYLKGAVVVQLSTSTIGEINIATMKPYDESTPEVCNTNSLLAENSDFVLPELCYKFMATSAGLFSLSFLDKLFWNGKELATNISSFAIHNNYLVATTNNLRQSLVVYRIGSGKQPLILPERAIERGATIAVTFDDSVIVYLPRGNLEVFQPRALAISTSRQMISSLRYDEVVALCRRLRIHLNLIVDDDLEKFLHNIDKFVQTVKPEYINLFITELSEEDITATKYAAHYKWETRHQQAPGKMNAVCSGLVENMMADKEKFIIPIISALVKLNRLNESFALVTTDKLFHHLLQLIELEKLYKVALSVYNLDFAYRVAQASQMDPLEYKPYLKSLQDMDSDYMKYFIDCSMNNHKSAIENISKCTKLTESQFDECVQFVQKHSLYSDAIIKFWNDEPKYKVFCEVYGDYLIIKGKYKEAGLMFKRSGKWIKAVEAFIKAGDWRECNLISKHLNGEKSEDSIFESLLNVLKSKRQYYDAGKLLEMLQKPGEAVLMYNEGKHWKDSLYLSSREHLECDATLSAIRDYSALLIDDIKNSKEQLSEYLSRFQVIQETESAATADDSNQPTERERTYLFSETSSIVSAKSEISSTSSRRTKKAIRKMWNLKVGNPREKVSLIHSMSQMMELAAGPLVADVSSTSLALLEISDDLKVVELEDTFDDYLSCLEKARSKIWPKHQCEDEIAMQDKLLEVPPKIVPPGWKVSTLK